MKRVKNYIAADLAKKKIARYKYWSIKDENGITICSQEDNNEEKLDFSQMLDKIISDNVDVEVQIKYGSNEQSSRHNPPMFIKVNEEIEWVEPVEEESVTINGVAHKVDKNGNVNINFTQPELQQQSFTQPQIETAQIDTFRQEMDLQLNGLKKEYELREEKWQMEMQNKLMEQTIKFKEMMLTERESRIADKEQQLAVREAELIEKEQEIKDDVKGYLKQVPSVLGGVVKSFIKNGIQSDDDLGEVEKKQRPKRRSRVNFEIEEDEPQQEFEFPEEELETDNIEEVVEPIKEIEVEENEVIENEKPPQSETVEA
jgi:hypothetical protein